MTGRQEFERLEQLFIECQQLTGAARDERIAALRDTHPDLIDQLLAMLKADDCDSDPLRDVVSQATDQLEPEHRRFGPWKVERTLGQGGMGQVYLASRDDGEYSQQAAIKTVRDPSEELLDRFRLERQVLADLDHPAIARLLDGGSLEGGMPYLVMEYVDGADILTHCDQNRLSVDDRIGLFCRLCDALQYAHTRLVVHRDIKPSNVYVDDAGQIKLLDFGIARLIGDEGKGGSTSIVSLHFAAPEQLSGGSITTATDVYALGLLLCHLLTGRGPYTLDGLAITEIAECIERPMPHVASELIENSDNEAIAELRSTTRPRLARRLQGDLDRIIAMACHPDPGQRYQSASALKLDLQNVLTGKPITARSPGLIYRSRLFLKRNALAATAALAGIATIIAVSVWYLIAITEEQQRVQQEAARANQVSTFLVGLFDAANPMTAEGTPPDAHALLDAGVERVESELSDQPLLQSSLLRTMGRAYLKLGDYQQADTLLQQSMALADPSGSDQATEDAASIHLLLADSTYNLGDEQASRDHNQQAISLIRSRFGTRHRTYATAITNLGVLHCAASEFDQCLDYYQQALDIRLSLFSPDDHRVGTSYNYLAMANQHAGNDESSVIYYRKSLQILQQTFGEHHPKVIDGKSNLAGGLNQLGQTDEARQLLDEALASARITYPEGSAYIAGPLLQLVLLLNQTEAYAEALPLARETVAIERAARGDAHPWVAYDLNLLGTSLLGVGQVDEAETAYLESQAILTAASDKPDYILMTAQQGLGRVYLARQQYKAAADVLQDTYDTRLTLDGPDSWVTIWTRYYMGLAQQGLGEVESAREHLRAVESEAMSRFPEDDARLKLVREALGTLP